MEIDDTYRINDTKAKRRILRISKCNDLSEFQALEIRYRDECIRKLKDNGLSIRQIERLTSINRGTVLKI